MYWPRSVIEAEFKEGLLGGDIVEKKRKIVVVFLDFSNKDEIRVVFFFVVILFLDVFK